MVNCNPETVSTDYDTSDRLYFEPLDTESVLAICEREKPDGVVIQFGGQTPLKLARVDRGRRLQDPRHAVRRGRPRGGSRALRRPAQGARPALAGVGDRRVAATRRSRSPSASATRCSSVPSYVLGGRAMRVCYDADDVREMPSFERDPRRPLRRERGRGRRRRALRRHRHVRRRGHAAHRGGRRALRRLVVHPARRRA